jgi:hypothetical protein
MGRGCPVRVTLASRTDSLKDATLVSVTNEMISRKVNRMNTTKASLQMVNWMQVGNGIQMRVSRLAREFDKRQHPSGIDLEIANRLRNLRRGSVPMEGAEYRSRFSSTRIEQVRIRMRLKQVAGLVSG